MVQTNGRLDGQRGFRVDEYGRGVAGRIVGIFGKAASSNRRAALFLVLLCLFAFLPGFFSIPPVDRDEARFAQATRQMVETGNLTDLRVGDEARHTLPFGLHWVQAAIVGGADAIGIPEARQSIWLYRLPSLLGAIAAVLFTFWAAIPFVGRRGALLAATLLAVSAALGVGARLAIPDALFLASIAAAMGALGRAYMAEPQSYVGQPPVSRSGNAAIDVRLAALFWGALALGVLVRGLMAPVYVLLPVVALAVTDRSLRFLRPLAPLAGAALCLLASAFWLYLLFNPGADGLAESATRTVIGRVAPSQRGVGAPPGAYLVMFWGLFWPAAPLAALAAPIIWKARRLRSVRYLLAWVLPIWLLFELLPTKLAGNVVPAFPAIAILIALAVERGAMALANMRLVRLLWLWPLVGAAIAVLALLGLAMFDRTTSFLAWPLLLAGFFALVTAAVSVRDYGVEKASLLAVGGMLVSGFGVMQLILPEMNSVWISPRLSEIAAQEICEGGGRLEVASAGYNEPSLVFLLPGRIRITDGSGAADFLAEGGCRAAFVERREEARFVRRAEALGMRIERGADVRGFNYSVGRRARISLYRSAGRGW